MKNILLLTSGSQARSSLSLSILCRLSIPALNHYHDQRARVGGFRIGRTNDGSALFEQWEKILSIKYTSRKCCGVLVCYASGAEFMNDSMRNETRGHLAHCDSQYGYAWNGTTAFTAKPLGSRILPVKLGHNGSFHDRSGHSGYIIEAALPCCIVCGQGEVGGTGGVHNVVRVCLQWLMDYVEVVRKRNTRRAFVFIYSPKVSDLSSLFGHWQCNPNGRTRCEELYQQSPFGLLY